MFEWYWIVPIIVILIIRFIYVSGQPKFWSLTRQYPKAAQFFFESHPDEWRLQQPWQTAEEFQSSPSSDWEGPYKFKMHGEKTPMLLYGNKVTLDESQAEFIKFVTSGRSAK